jgi:hypothetical protein
MAKSIVVRLAARRYCAGCSATRNGWPAEPGGAELQQAVLAQRRTALATIAKRLDALAERGEAGQLRLFMLFRPSLQLNIIR